VCLFFGERFSGSPGAPRRVGPKRKRNPLHSWIEERKRSATGPKINQSPKDPRWHDFSEAAAEVLPHSSEGLFHKRSPTRHREKPLSQWQEAPKGRMGARPCAQLKKTSKDNRSGPREARGVFAIREWDDQPQGRK